MCDTLKKDLLFEYLDQIKYTTIDTTNDIKIFAGKIVNDKILTIKQFDDCLHLATAVLNDCHIIVSWNFKHFVKEKTINGIRRIAFMNFYNSSIDVFSPTMFLEQEN